MPTMLMVSCRSDFWSPTEFSTTDEIRRVDLDSGVGTLVSQTEFPQELRSKRLTVLTHGYNNEERDVIDSYGAIDRQMRQLGFLGGAGAAYDALVGFSWPSGAVGRVVPVPARQRAGESASRFARLLAELRSATPLIDLNTHSLGAHVALEALRGGAQRLVRNAWNFASAVDNESIEDGERYYEASRRCERFYVFHSRNDPVLRSTGSAIFSTSYRAWLLRSRGSWRDHQAPVERPGGQLQGRGAVARRLPLEGQGGPICRSSSPKPSGYPVRHAGEDAGGAERRDPGRRRRRRRGRHAPAPPGGERSIGRPEAKPSWPKALQLANKRRNRPCRLHQVVAGGSPRLIFG